MKNKILLWLFVFFAISYTSYSVDYSSCYQEFSNVSTACGGLNTGNYSFNIGSVTNADLAFDGNWATFAETASSGETKATYSKPVNATNATIRLKGGDNTEHNYTLPAACFNRLDEIVIIVEMAAPITTDFRCLNGSGTRIVLANISGGTANYEEGVFWNISSNITLPFNIDWDSLTPLNNTTFDTGTGNMTFYYDLTTSSSIIINLTVDGIINQTQTRVTSGTYNFNYSPSVNSSQTKTFKLLTAEGNSSEKDIFLYVETPFNASGAMELTDCPDTVPKAMNLWLIVMIALVFFSISMFTKVYFVGFFASIFLFISSWFLVACHGIYAFTLGTFSILALFWFVFKSFDKTPS